MSRLSIDLKCMVGFTEVQSIKAGSEFDLAMTVKDLRPELEGMSRGVFAAYCNVSFSSKDVMVSPAVFKPPYVNGKHFEINARGNGLVALGAFAGLQPTGPGEFEVCRVRMKALWPATIGPSINSTVVSFRVNFTDIKRPHYDTLLYGTRDQTSNGYYPGEHSWVNVDEIDATGATLVIAK